MHKIRLEIETLNVESFAPGGAASSARGTVDAHAPTRTCPPATGMTLCVTNCECTFGCPTEGPCTQ